MACKIRQHQQYWPNTLRTIIKCVVIVRSEIYVTTGSVYSEFQPFCRIIILYLIELNFCMYPIIIYLAPGRLSIYLFSYIREQLNVSYEHLQAS